MVEGKRLVLRSSSDFDSAVSAWEQAGEAAPLTRWLDRELDADGFPGRLAVPAWHEHLARIAEARRCRDAEWPESLDARVEGWFRQLLRFSRPNGSSVFSAGDTSSGTKELFRYWAENLTDPGLDTVVRWWFPLRERPEAPPPLPAAARLDSPLAILRAHWQAVGDFVAIDHRQPGTVTSLELFAAGRPWLGPQWSWDGEPAGSNSAAMTTWITNSSVDLAEWSFRAGESRCRRQALVLRGRKVALLADEVEGASPDVTIRYGLSDGVEARSVGENRSLVLEGRGGRASVRILPLGLPDTQTAREDGALVHDASGLRLRQTSQGKRTWLPLLISWDSQRNRRSVRWRRLTVTERGEVCPAATATAFRVSWGRDETLVIYRSLARPSSRTFLGYQTRARFFVGLFDRQGDVTSIFNLEE